MEIFRFFLKSWFFFDIIIAANKQYIEWIMASNRENNHIYVSIASTKGFVNFEEWV